MSKLDVEPSSKNVTKSDSATCFIVPLSLQTNLSAAASVVDVAEVPPSQQVFNSVVVTFAPSRIPISVEVRAAKAADPPD